MRYGPCLHEPDNVCLCRLDAAEPNPKCPQHGYEPEQVRCIHCGQFIVSTKWWKKEETP